MAKKLKPEVLVSCLDVLCRANASLKETDSKLASEITDSIQALTDALENHSEPEEEGYRRKDNSSKPVKRYEDNIVDLFTNEVLYQGAKRVNKDKFETI